VTTFNSPQLPPVTQRLPWPFVASALVAFAALYASGKFFVLMPVLAVLLVATAALPWRLPSSKILGWVVRVAVWIVVLSISPRRHTTGMSLNFGGSILYEPDYVHLFGYLAAAELVLRAWTFAPRGPSRGDALLLTALVLTAASNTTDRMPIQVLAPAYALLTILCLRAFDRSPGGRATDLLAPPHRSRPPLLALRAVAAVLAVGLAFSAVFVVTQYEYSITNWAMQFARSRPARQTEVGLSTSPQLTSVFNPQPSMNRVMLVEGPYADRHLRALAFDTYLNGQWLPALAHRQFELMPPPDLHRGTAGARLQFTPLVDTFELILLPLESAEVEFPGSIARDAQGCLLARAAPEDPHYAATVLPNSTFQGPLCLAPDDALRQRLLAIPPTLAPAVVSLARDVAGPGDPASRVQNLVRHLRTQHAYSLQYDPGDGEPLNDFILNARAAHCQYFASALAIMARAAGVPARYVNGYYAHELFGKNQTVVRDRDAHAWTECYLDGTGWVTVDATPDSGRPDQLFEQPSRWRHLLEYLQDLPRRIRAWASQLTLQSATVLTSLPVAVLLVVWLIRLLRTPRKLNAGARSYAERSAELSAAARRFDRVLAQVGHPCTPHRTWREHLVRLPDAVPVDREKCRTFVDAYEEARFGDCDERALAAAQDVLRELEVAPSPHQQAKEEPVPAGRP
jgi:transglutaminase-like putative cysteine protease